MTADFDDLFGRLRRGPWNESVNAVPQEIGARNGNIESQGWLADDSVTSDVIRTNAVIARHITADAVTAGKIAADAITAREIAADSVTASEIAANTITAAEIAANTITAAEIAANAVTADEIAANTITAAEIAADTITANEIAALTITAGELAADSVITSKILAGNVTSSRIELTISGKNYGANGGSATAPGVFFDSASNFGLGFYNTGLGNVMALTAGGASKLSFASGGGVVAWGNVTPVTDNTYAIGNSVARWTEVWAVDGTINTSDERQKKDIEDAPLGLDFVRSLRPRAYRWRDTADTQAQEAAAVDQVALAEECAPHRDRIRQIRQQQVAGEISDADGDAEVAELRETIHAIEERHVAPAREAAAKRRPGKRQHYGLIAQEVKAALDAAGVDAAFWKETKDGKQALSYSELIAPLIKAVQELAARVDHLER